MGPAFELPVREPILVAHPRALLSASASATRSSPKEVLASARARRLLVQAAAQIGRPDIDGLAQLLKIHPRSVRRYLEQPPTDRQAINAILLCLGDPRLHRHGFE